MRSFTRCAGLCLILLGPPGVAFGHDDPATPAQARELAEFRRCLRADAGRVTAENLRKLEPLLRSYERADLEHAAAHLTQPGTWDDALREAIVAVRYYRYIVRHFESGPAMAVGLASGTPEELGQVMALLLREIDTPAATRALEHLSKDTSPAVRAMVGWILPAYWHFRASGLPAEAQWARGIGHRLANDSDPAVISAIAAHLLLIPEPTLLRALMRYADDERKFLRPSEGFLRWATSPLSKGIRAAVVGHLRHRVGRLPRGALDAKDLAAWVAKAGSARDLLVVDEDRWARVADEVLLLGSGQAGSLRAGRPALEARLASQSFATEVGTPNVTACLELRHAGRVVMDTGTHLCSLGSATFTTVSCDGPKFEASEAGSQTWKTFVMAIPSGPDKLRIRIVLWVGRDDESE